MEKNKVVGRYSSASRARRKRKLSFRLTKKIFYFVFTASAFGGIFYFLFVSSVFSIKEVNITGLKTIPEKQVMAEVNNIFSSKKFGFLESRNYFIFSVNDLKASLDESFPKVGEITIKKDPEVLEIVIEEREAIGVWCSGRECFYFDKHGIIFEEAPKSTGSLILSIQDGRKMAGSDPAILGEAVLNGGQISFFQEAKDLVSRNFPFNVRKFIITEKSDFELITSETWRVLLDKKESPEYQLSNLKYLLDEEIKTRRLELEYVDLRLGNRLYYKYRGENVNPEIST